MPEGSCAGAVAESNGYSEWPGQAGRSAQKLTRWNSWRRVLLDRGLHETKLGYERAGKAALFSRLVGLMTAAGSDDSCREAAADLAMTEGAVKVAVHRMRRRFRDILRAQIAETVDPDELDDEIGFLIRAVGRRSTQP